MVKTLMLKVCEYNNPNVKFGFVSLDLVLSSRLQNYFGQRLCRINKCMGLESCELETPESRRDKPSLFFTKKSSLPCCSSPKLTPTTPPGAVSCQSYQDKKI